MLSPETLNTIEHTCKQLAETPANASRSDINDRKARILIACKLRGSLLHTFIYTYVVNS